MFSLLLLPFGEGGGVKITKYLSCIEYHDLNPWSLKPQCLCPCPKGIYTEAPLECHWSSTWKHPNSMSFLLPQRQTWRQTSWIPKHHHPQPKAGSHFNANTTEAPHKPWRFSEASSHPTSWSTANIYNPSNPKAFPYKLHLKWLEGKCGHNEMCKEQISLDEREHEA